MKAIRLMIEWVDFSLNYSFQTLLVFGLALAPQPGPKSKEVAVQVN
jgi:hypothetical protein